MLKSLLFLIVLILPLHAEINVLDAGAFHTEAEIGNASYPSEWGISSITGTEAAVLANAHLSEMGADSVLFCRIKWIAAPLGGYLIDGLFSLDIEGISYSTFRIGIADDSEMSLREDYFTFIARGVSNEGSVLWYPMPGPDFIPSEDETRSVSLEYEFLLDREQFEALETDFPR